MLQPALMLVLLQISLTSFTLCTWPLTVKSSELMIEMIDRVLKLKFLIRIFN